MTSLPPTHHRGFHHLLRALPCLLALLAAHANPLLAQSSTQGAIAGRMPGFSIALGDPIVTARDEQSQQVLQARGTSSGDFFLELPPGDYTIEVEAPGLPPIHREHVPITLGSITDLNAPTQLAPDPATILQSLANPDSDSSGESLPSFRGLPATLNAATLDGANQTQSFSGTTLGAGSPIDPQAEDDSTGSETDTSATSRSSASSRSLRSAAVPFTYARSAIRQFHLTGDTYSALYGAAPGGILTAITRSGGEHLHGSASFAYRSSAFAATNPYAIATHYTAGLVTSAAIKPDDSRQTFGGSLGGPILPHRRLFFFAAAEAERRNFPAISSPQDPNFYTLTPTQTALLLNRGVRSSAIAAALTYVDSLTGPTPRASNGNVLFTRLDYHASDHILTSVSYNNSRWNQPAGALSAPVLSRARASLGNSTDNLDAFQARLVLYLNPSLFNEFRVQHSHSLAFQSTQTPLPQEPAIGPNNLPPEIAIGPQGLTFGTPANLGRTAYPEETRLQLIDLISFSKGRNHLQLGIDLETIHTFVSALANQQGTFRYDSASTTRGRAGGLVDFITDYTFNVHAYPNGACPSINAAIHLFCFRSFTQTFGQQDVTFDTRQLAGYVQDDIRLLPALTLHVGARYDYQLLPFPQLPNSTLDATFLTQAATGIFPEDRNNLAPRVALALRLGQTTIRAGYGIFFGRLPGATIRAALLNTDLPTSTTRIRITPSTITNCPQVANQGFGYPCAYLASPAAALPATSSATLFARNFRLPDVQQASLAIERQLPARFTLEATLRANLDRQLPNSVDLNIAPSTVLATFQLQGGTGLPGVTNGETFVLPLYAARRLSTVGPVTAITSAANATYNGITLELRRTGPTLSFNASFTHSRAIDFAPTQGAIPRTDTQLDPYNLRYDKGLSSLNFPSRIAAYATWQPHLEASSPTLRDLANGWSLAPIFIRRSGAPYSYTLSGGPSLSGGSESLNASGGALYLPTVGRNTLRLPNATTFDLRLARTIPLRDSIRLRATAEAFNLANHVNFSGVTQRAFLVGAPVAGITPLVFQDAAAIAAEGVNTRPFGTPIDSGTSEARARALQFALRLEF